MSAADRIEAVAHEIEDGPTFDPTRRDHVSVIRTLRAIAAELRGAPALTEEQDAALEVAMAAINTWPNCPGGPKALAVLRALRTERTPSEGG